MADGKIVVSKNRTHEIITAHQDPIGACHWGVYLTLRMIQRRFYFQRMRKLVTTTFYCVKYVIMRKQTITDPTTHGARVLASAEMAGNRNGLNSSVAQNHPRWRRLRQRTHGDVPGYQDDALYPDMEGSHGRRHREPIHQIHRQVPRVARSIISDRDARFMSVFWEQLRSRLISGKKKLAHV